MAERALLVRGLSDGRYVVATSRWGGTDSALAAVCAGTAPMGVSGVDWKTCEYYTDFPAVVASLDVLTTALCYRIEDGNVTVFLPLWFGLPLATVCADPSVGALVAVESVAEARACRRWFRSLKGALADALTDGTVPWSAVPLVLLAGVAGLAPRERYLSVGSAERL